MAAEPPQVGKTQSVSSQRGNELTSSHGSVKVSRLNKFYSTPQGKLEVLRDINFDIAPGEVVSIVGASGCGKSTLLKILAGLIPYQGDVEINGAELSGPRDDIGVMFQSSLLFPWRTVESNVLMPARIQRSKGPEMRERVLELLEMVGLADFAQRYPHELSGGMQQRAALCRTLLMNPDLLLLDEPFGALDELTREKLNLALLEIQQATHKTLILVTHSLYEAVFLSDRVLVMTPRPGEIVKEIVVDLPRPRDIDVMTTESFLSLVVDIRHLLGLDTAAEAR